jgi:hypothetical protein
MNASPLIAGVVLCAASWGCTSRPPSALQPLAERWEFAHGMGNWQTPHAGEAELASEESAAYLRLHKTKNNLYGGQIFKTIHLGQRDVEEASMLVVAKAMISPAPLSIRIGSFTGNQNGPTYGQLDSSCIDCDLTSTWATYKVTLKIPPEAKDVEFMISINEPKSTESSVAIRSIEYMIGERPKSVGGEKVPGKAPFKAGKE